MDWIYPATIIAGIVAVPVGYALQRTHELSFRNFALLVLFTPQLLFGVLCTIAAFLQGLDATVGTPAGIVGIASVTLSPLVLGAFIAQLHKRFRYQLPWRASVRVLAKA